jgi:plasmid stabilization system protein ParE
MKVAYTPRAVADLSEIGAQSRKTFGSAVAAALESYIRATVARIAVMPESGQRLPGGAGGSLGSISVQDFLYGRRGDGHHSAHSTRRAATMGRVGGQRRVEASLGRTRIVRNTRARLDIIRPLCHVNFAIERAEAAGQTTAFEKDHVMRYFFPRELDLASTCCSSPASAMAKSRPTSGSGTSSAWRGRDDGTRHSSGASSITPPR